MAALTWPGALAGPPRDDGGGLGYDVLSYDLKGHKRYIEVKTTRLGGAKVKTAEADASLSASMRHPDGLRTATRAYVERGGDLADEPQSHSEDGRTSKCCHICYL